MLRHRDSLRYRSGQSCAYVHPAGLSSRLRERAAAPRVPHCDTTLALTVRRNVAQVHPPSRRSVARRWLLLSELYPTKCRGLAMSIGSTACWVFTTMVRAQRQRPAKRWRCGSRYPQLHLGTAIDRPRRARRSSSRSRRSQMRSASLARSSRSRACVSSRGCVRRLGAGRGALHVLRRHAVATVPQFVASNRRRHDTLVSHAGHSASATDTLRHSQLHAPPSPARTAMSPSRRCGCSRTCRRRAESHSRRSKICCATGASGSFLHAGGAFSRAAVPAPVSVVQRAPLPAYASYETSQFI